MAMMSGALFLSLAFFLNCCLGVEPRPFSRIEGSNYELSSNADNVDKELIKIFDEILQQVYPSDLSTALNYKAKTSGQQITRRDVDGDHLLEKKRAKEPSLFNRDVRKTLTMEAKEAPQEAVNPDVQSKSPPCRQLLQFLQKNILVAAITMMAIFAILVLVLLLFSAYIRRKQPLYPPANVKYSIYIINGKTWCQNTDEKISKILQKR